MKYPSTSVLVAAVGRAVTQRGNRRRETFFCDDDYQTYPDLLDSDNYVWCPRNSVSRRSSPEAGPGTAHLERTRTDRALSSPRVRRTLCATRAARRRCLSARPSSSCASSLPTGRVASAAVRSPCALSTSPSFSWLTERSRCQPVLPGACRQSFCKTSFVRLTIAKRVPSGASFSKASNSSKW